MIRKQEADIIGPLLDHQLIDTTAQRTFFSTAQANKKSLMAANSTKMEINVFSEGTCQTASQSHVIIFFLFPRVKIAQT